MAILNQEQIAELFNRYRNVVDYINEQNNGVPQNRRIKQIQIPYILTQSLVYHYIVNNPHLIGLQHLQPNLLSEGTNRTYDLIYRATGNINIEVKATGTSNFQRFRQHALTATYVFWINFNQAWRYDIAVFNPNVLQPNDRGEVDIDWNRLQPLQNVTFIRGLNI